LALSREATLAADHLFPAKVRSKRKSNGTEDTVSRIMSEVNVEPPEMIEIYKKDSNGELTKPERTTDAVILAWPAKRGFSRS
jgi:hypothetical protein